MGHLVRTCSRRLTESAVCIGDVYGIGAAQFRYPSHASLAGNCLGAGASKTWHFKYSRQAEPARVLKRKAIVESNLSLLVEDPLFAVDCAKLNHIMHHQAQADRGIEAHRQLPVHWHLFSSKDTIESRIKMNSSQLPGYRGETS